MTTQIAVNAANDIHRDALGNLALVYDINAIMEAAQQAAQARRGEMQYAVDNGLPFFGVLWSGAPSLAQFKAALRSELLGVTGVTRVQDLQVQLAGDVVRYSVTIQTIYGSAVLNG